jgi:GNAT superfamily N-acetyltransferase
MTISIRPARAEDVTALVRLRLANAQRHVELDSAAYRRPAPEAVRRHFHDRLSNPGNEPPLILVAEVAGEVAGMVEIVIEAGFPDHQIAVPRRTAQVHTVVLDGYRGMGVGTALVRAGERHAAELGVAVLIAAILASNAGAISFYAGAGFGDHGVLLGQKLTPGRPGAGQSAAR